MLDDNFLQPQPGTSAGDHLVSGLVPLTLLALAAWTSTRLRGGLRGAVAMSLGVLGIAAGIEGFHYAREVGASGDDFTGLLCLPAGLLLIGLGAVTLWRTRRTDDHLPAATRAAACSVVPPDQLSVAHENVSFRTSDGLRLEG